MRAAAAIVGLILLNSVGVDAHAQQCIFKCTCADPADSMVACPRLNAEQCAQAAQRASVGGVACTASMGVICEPTRHIATPPGGYTQTCQDCQHDCTFLLCACKSADGTLKQSGINYAACPGHSVVNVDGRLACGR